MVRYRSPYHMPRKHRGGRTGTILFSHKFGARRRWVINVTPWQLSPGKRPGSLCTGGLGGPWTVQPDEAIPDPSPMMDMFLFPPNRWYYTGSSLLLVITRTSLGKETRPGRQRTVRTNSVACHDDSGINDFEHK
jgi:hypothetical protein